MRGRLFPDHALILSLRVFPVRYFPGLWLCRSCAKLAELDNREAQMIGAIKLLRETGDDCQRRASQASDRAVQAELIDISTGWHWLAREAARLHARAKQLENA